MNTVNYVIDLKY